MVPFNQYVEVPVANGDYANAVTVALAAFIPANGLLVVEFVSTACDVTGGQKPNPSLIVRDARGAVVVEHFPLAQFQMHNSLFGQDNYKSADPIRLHLTRDQSLELVAERDKKNGNATFFFGISGYVTP